MAVSKSSHTTIMEISILEYFLSIRILPFFAVLFLLLALHSPTGLILSPQPPPPPTAASFQFLVGGVDKFHIYAPLDQLFFSSSLFFGSRFKAMCFFVTCDIVHISLYAVFTHPLT